MNHQCPDCGHELRRGLAECPGCGRMTPLRVSLDPGSLGRRVGVGLIVIAAGLLLKLLLMS